MPRAPRPSWRSRSSARAATDRPAQKTVSNLDESKVGPYTLPDPLLLADGRKVVTSAQWNQERRPELLHLFETHVYGKVPEPAKPIQPRFLVKSEDQQALGGTAIRREVSIVFSEKPDGPRIDLLLYLPKKVARRDACAGISRDELQGKPDDSPRPGHHPLTTSGCGRTAKVS